MNIREILKGIIIGIAKIIPGLSGAVIMISFNLYDKAIEAITSFFDNPKKNFWFLFSLGIGVVIGIVMFSNILSYFVTNYYVYTTSLFIGLIFGGVPVIINNTDRRKIDYIIMIVSFGVMCLISLSGIDNNYVIRNNFFDLVVFFVSGLLEAVGTVLPGVSSTALLMLMGVYNLYLTILGNAFNFNYLISTLRFVIPFSLGMLIGIVLLAILVNYLFKYYKSITFSIILGIAFSSVFLLIVKVIWSINTIRMIPFSVILFGIGYFVTSKI